mgnify:CR=1 FL=1
MPEVWFPQAIRDPGRQANYRSGRCAAWIDVAHETVGRDSRGLIRDQGLAWILFPKAGPPIQFAPCNSTTAHACEFNTTGAGHEVERFPGEPPTADQIHWIGEVLRWRNREWGVPLEHHVKENGRLPIGTGFRGTADHGGLTHHKCDQHTDGWPDPEYATFIAVAPAPPPPPPLDSSKGTFMSVAALQYDLAGNLTTAYVENDGSLRIESFRPGKGWDVQIVAGPGQQLGSKGTDAKSAHGVGAPAVLRDYRGAKGTLQVFAKAEGDGLVSAAFVPNEGWKSDTAA